MSIFQIEKTESSEEDDSEEEYSQNNSISETKKVEKNEEEDEMKIKKPNYSNFVKAGQNNSFNGQNVSNIKSL